MPDGFEPPVFLRPGETPPGAPVTPGQPWIPGGATVPAGDAPDGMGFPAEDPVRPWPWWLALVALAAAFLAIIVAGVLFALVGELLGASDNLLDDYDFVFGILQDVLWVAVAIGIPLSIVHWIRPEHLGLRRRHLGFSALKLAIALFGFYLLAAVYSVAAGLDENSNKLLQDTGFGDSLGKDLAYAFLYPVAAPVAEEFLFRGVLFKGLRDGLRGKLGRGAAVGLSALISGAIFGSLHLGGGQDAFIPVLIALGVLLALAYEWSGTLYVPIVIHALNNTIATASSSEPTQDWVYGVIVAGPVFAVLLTMLLARFIRTLPSEPPPTLPPSLPTAIGGPPPAEPPFGRPPGL